MIDYDLPLYRPPSEARSLIIQATIGCSHNQCTFCSMYKTKQFRSRALDDIQKDLLDARSQYPVVHRIFLADGDAMALSSKRLVQILESIAKIFPECQRVGIYATSKNIRNKSLDDLRLLHSLGIGIVYMGLESGDDQILSSIHKGENSQDIIHAARKVMESGMKLSMTVISGLGGKKFKEIHAIETARTLSAIKPHYIGFLALMIEPSSPLFEDYHRGLFTPLSAHEIVDEMILILSTIHSEGSIFRCNHASNYFSLAGRLNDDREQMLADLQEIKQDLSQLKDEHFRRL